MCKRMIASILMVIIGCVLVTGTPAEAASANVSIYVNDKKIDLPISTVPMDKSSILVPFRSIGEALGIDVKWIASSRQVSAKEAGTDVLFTLNQEKTIVNKKTINVSPAPRIVEASTVIPLRFFAETFGAEVSWDNVKKEARINRQTASKPGSDIHAAYLGVVERADTLNVRSGPSQDHSSLGKVTRGERVEVLGFTDRWARIMFNGKEAYVHSYYLDLATGNQKVSMLGQPVVAASGNTTSITWPKIGGTITTTHTQSGNKVTIQTDALESERLTQAVKGLSGVTHAKNSKGQTITFTVSNDYQATISHTVGEVIVNVGPKVTGQGQPLAGKKIVIDPGHGGSDPGGGSNGLKEKDVVLDVGIRVERLLRAAGAHVITTRDADVYPTLTSRVKLANDVKADLFISIHTNAATSTAASGTETFWHAKYAAGESKKLATSIHKRMMEKLGTRDRGVKEGNFQVIRETKMPSVLLELAFITNSGDAELMKKDSFRQNSAQAVYEGLVDYYK